MSNTMLMEINKDALNDAENIEALTAAAGDILGDTTLSFEEMKKKKWYNRLWETVTFSKDGEKRLAKGVSNLAQMQDIVIKMLMMLSRENAKVASLVNSCADKIDRLAGEVFHNSKEIDLIKEELHRNVFFFNRVKLSEITTDDKKLILCAAMKYAEVVCDIPNASVQEYLRNFRKGAGIADIPDTDLFEYESLENLSNSKSNELYITIISEITALIDAVPEDNDVFVEATENASLSPKKKKDIWERLAKTIKVEGKESIAQGYFEPDTSALATIESDGIEFAEGEKKSGISDEDFGEAQEFFEKGEAYSEDDDHESAIREYTKAIRLRPDYAEAYYSRALSYVFVGDCDTAIIDLDKAIALVPNSALYLSSRAEIYNNQEKYDNAVADYTESIRLENENAEYYNSRGEVYQAKDDYDSAIKDYTTAIQLDPDNSTAFANRGFAYYLNQNHESALRDFDKAIKLDADNSLAFLNRGLAYYFGHNDFEAALADFERYLRLSPGDETAQQCVIKALIHIYAPKIAPYENQLHFVDTDEVDGAKVNKAISEYANDATADDIVAIVDTSFFGGGGKGLTFSPSILYVSEGGNVAYQFIKKITLQDETHIVVEMDIDDEQYTASIGILLDKNQVLALKEFLEKARDILKVDDDDNLSEEG